MIEENENNKYQLSDYKNKQKDFDFCKSKFY